jgi:hypothetical protein
LRAAVRLANDGAAIDATGFMTAKAPLGCGGIIPPQPFQYDFQQVRSTDDCCAFSGAFTCRVHGLVEEARHFTAPDSYIPHCPACHNWYGQVPGIVSYSGALPIFVHPPEDIAKGRKAWPG